MKQERPMVVLAAVIVQITLLFAPAQGQESHDNWFVDLQGNITKSLESSQQNKAVQRAVVAELDRNDLRTQSDYRRYSGDANRDLDWIIRQAYDETSSVGRRTRRDCAITGAG